MNIQALTMHINPTFTTAKRLIRIILSDSARIMPKMAIITGKGLSAFSNKVLFLKVKNLTSYNEMEITYSLPLKRFVTSSGLMWLFALIVKIQAYFSCLFSTEFEMMV